jgi:Ca2+-dependent lipid-binding protein
MNYTTSIAKYTQNPFWNYHTLIEAKKATSYIHFYIYNNNPNAIDELLAYAKLEFGELMTRTNSRYKLRLVNSLE